MRKKSMLILGVVLSISIIITIIVMFVCNKQPKNDVQISQEYKNLKETDSRYFLVSANGTVTLATEYQVGGQFHYELPSEIVIPKKINGTTITTIANGAFENCYSISYIQIPNTVTEIGSTFQNCSVQEITILGKSPSIRLIDVNNLNKVNIPDGTIDVTIRSSSLSHLEVPASVTYLDLTCDNLVQLKLPSELEILFLHCANLKDIDIPNSVYKLNLRGCSSIDKITIPSNVITLEDYDNNGGAFQDCINLKEITLNEGLQSIPSHTFENCTSLESIHLPSNIENIGENAFANSGITKIQCPDSVRHIDDEAFANSAISKIELPCNLNFIGTRAFADSNLTEISLPITLCSIGDEAFARTNLTEITISCTFAELGRELFADCQNLEQLDFR